MATITLGGESIAAYVERRYRDLVENQKNGKFPGVTDDAAGANAAAKYILMELKKNPSSVTETLPPDSTYIEKMINNPGSPLSWLNRKVTRATKAVKKTVLINLDNPVTRALDNNNPFSKSNTLPWFLQPASLVLGAVAFYLIPKVAGSSIEGLVRGYRNKTRLLKREK